MKSALSLSVIVPVHNGAATLDQALIAILASEMLRDDFELIVVDDASSDGSATVAARYADTVVRLTGRESGPAYARNRGAELARGEVIAFVDADAMVQSRTLPGMLEMLAAHSGLDAIAASHDQTPAESNFASQYWNLLVHFGEQRYAAKVGSFTSGCAAIRRSVLLAVGMYDEWRFGTACLESVELGKRLVEAGYGVLLSRELQVTQLKRWTIWSVCREAWDRSSLLARSLGYQRTRESAPTEVVFTLSRTVAPAFAVICTIFLCSAFFAEPGHLLAVTMVVTGLIILNLSVHRFFARTRGLAFAIAAAPVHVLMQLFGGVALCTGRLMRDAVGDRLPDAATQAYAEVGVEIWPPVRRAK
jgi:cellulose synthase/poly-beta-1,6-N-acetylglucosamine synthase-like glycosyltransferase